MNLKSNWKLGLIIIFGLVLRLVFFNGLMRHDDVMYLLYTKVLYKDFSHISSLHGLWAMRFSLYLPTLFIIKLFSPITTDFYPLAFIFPLLSSILSIVFIYLISRELFNEKTALIASFLYAILPLDIFCSTTIRGDVESVMFFLLGFWTILKYRRNDSWILLFIVSLILLYTSKIALIVPLLFLSMLFLNPRKWLPVFLSAVLVVQLDFLVFGSNSILTTVMSYYSEHSTPSDISAKPELGFCMLTNIITPNCHKLLENIIFQNSYWVDGSFMLTSFYFLLSIILLPLAFTNKNWIKILSFVLIFSLYMTFGMMSEKSLFHKEPRYFLYIFAMVSMLLGYELSKLRDIFPWVLLLLIANLSILQATSHYWYKIPDNYLDRAYEFISSDKSHDIIADSLIYFYFDLRSGYKYGSRTLGIYGDQYLDDLGTMKYLSVQRPTYLVMTDLFTYPALNNQRHPNEEPIVVFGKGKTAVKIYELLP